MKATLPLRTTALLLALFTLAGLASAGSADAARRILLGVNIADAPGKPAALDSYTRQVGRQPDIVMWYQTFQEGLYYESQAKAVVERNVIPMVTWEPARAGRGIPLRDIVAGRHDSTIHDAAAAAKRFGRPMFIRFGHEMNLKGSLWAAGRNGNRPADFAAAWRHVVQIFRNDGVTNVQWVWSPNIDFGGAPFKAYYPGDEWTDWVALDGYNWGAHGYSGWKSITQTFMSSYNTLRRISNKPIMIAETAAPERGGDKASWIRKGFLSEIPKRLTEVHAVIWFNRDKETDWRINSSFESLAAWREVVNSPIYGGDGSLRARAPKVSVATRCRGGRRVICKTSGRLAFGTGDGTGTGTGTVQAAGVAPKCSGRVRIGIRVGKRRYRSTGSLNSRCVYRAKTRIPRRLRRRVRRARVTVVYLGAESQAVAGPKRVRYRRG